jgi:hypothetical protein
MSYWPTRTPISGRLDQSVARLRSWGMTVLFDLQVYPLPTPNMGPSAATLFLWEALVEQVRIVQADPEQVRRSG